MQGEYEEVKKILEFRIKIPQVYTENVPKFQTE